jgi:hypothetical protein
MQSSQFYQPDFVARMQRSEIRVRDADECAGVLANGND